MTQYPLNRDHLLRIVEQKQKQLFGILKVTSVGLIRLAADESSTNQAVQSISYYESLWGDVFDFNTKWRTKIMAISQTFMTDNERLNSELEVIEQEFTTESQTIYTALNNLKKKK